MKSTEKRKILKKAKEHFKDIIVVNHIKNTKKLKLKEFNINPFLLKYLANYLAGNSKPENIAKSLIYPRVLGTSITTSFGQNFQTFCSESLGAYASTTEGLDIEFIDQIDKRRKYCQLKAGPNCINKEDVPVIKKNFKGIKHRARSHKLNLQFDDLIVGVFYGIPEELNGHFKKLEKEYPVYIGKEFWHRLTGENDFYSELINSVTEVAIEIDASKVVSQMVSSLAKEIKENLP